MTEDDLVIEISKMRPRPQQFVAVLANGKEQPIASQPGRNRWRRIAMSAMSAMRSGARIEARDANSALLKSWDADDVDDGGSIVTPHKTEIHVERERSLPEAEEQRLLLIARIEDMAVERSMRFLRPITDLLVGLLRETTQRQASIERAQSQLVKAMVDANIAKGQAEVALMQADAELQRAHEEAARAQAQSSEPTAVQQFASIALEKLSDGKLKVPPNGIPDPTKPD